MPLYALRVWLPDRPGALGSVASRIGAVDGDLVGIDILERGAGRAIDELIVELGDASVVPQLLKELASLEGVDVEDIRPIEALVHDPRLDALTSAVALVESVSVDSLLQSLVRNAAADFEADWAAVIDVEHTRAGGGVLASIGTSPESVWLRAFITGSQASIAAAVDDVIWVPMSASDLTLLIGRSGRPLRARERRQATALARIADSRWVEHTRRSLA
jgi:ACT domain